MEFRQIDLIRNPEKIDFLMWMNLVDKEIENQSDRSLALLSAAIIDEQLEFILKTFLLEDKHIQKRIFDNNCPLSTLSAKNNMCYYLGLISKHEYNTIDLIRKIRNIFAHEITVITFEDDKKITGLCNSLSIPKGMYVPNILLFDNEHILNLDDEPLKGKSLKERFVLTFRYLTQYLNVRYIDIIPNKRKEYIAKTQAQLLANTMQIFLEYNKEIIQKYKKILDLLLKEKEFCQKNKISFSEEKQNEIDKIMKEIKKYEDNPLSDSEGSILNIDFQDYMKFYNLIKNELERQESHTE